LTKSCLVQLGKIFLKMKILADDRKMSFDSVEFAK